MPSRSTHNWSPRVLLLIATALVMVSVLMPYGEFLLYPFQLFGTFIHEVSHAVAAVATGGQVHEMRVNLDTSGHVLSSGGSRMLISSAGYTGSILVAAAILLAGRRRRWARRTLFIVGGATLLSTVAFGGAGITMIAGFALAIGVLLAAAGHRHLQVQKARRGWSLLGTGGLLSVAALIYLTISGALLTWAIGLGMGALILGVALFARPVLQHLTVLFLGVMVAFDGIDSVRVLLRLTTNNLVDHSDAINMANHTGIPATFWAVLWAVSGVLVIVGAFWLFWRDERTASKRS